ncbi:Glioma tumor suppressor candidate region gene 2 protein-like isoform X2 [Oopsacas minuta]|uniref:Ribosome biogenesis protein NOP53 n=1 Tax=Oopsacas minuta TaxID=111878 RepID=A0AAV7JQX0_9METZ|nr:Glioma tumor suppressor candidate region gene 2 protein-like isoform X2 [Oopsacas minuta]
MFCEPIWEDKTTVNKTPDSDFVELIAKVTKPKLKVPQSVLHGRTEKRNPLLPAVLLPHPGASYRPKEDEHTQLLQSVRTGEERRQRAEHKLRRSLRGMRYMSKKDIRKEERQQMREGLFKASERKSESDDNATLVTTSDNKQKVKKKKRKRKGVAMERRRALLEHEKRKLDIRQSEDIKNIKSLIKQLDIHTTLKKKRHSPLTKRLGKLRYHEPIREFQLRSQIAPGLGRLVAEGNLLRDRYKSLQKRNIIEVRQKKILKRKYQLKAYQKNSYKEFT